MKLKKPLFRRVVKAQLQERYIFNFRLKPDVLASLLPVKWLQPQVLNGWSVVSFCILEIDKMTVAPIPNLFNYSTISCAYRIGVIDNSGPVSTPSVYITDRNADLALVTKLSPYLLADAIPYAKASISHEGDTVRIQCNYADGQGLFAAQAKLGAFTSELFGSVEDFKEFIKNGVSSYTPSIYPNMMARVDLKKTDTDYRAMEGNVEFSWLDGVWSDAGLILDSIVRAKGGEYKWSYRGLATYD